MDFRRGQNTTTDFAFGGHVGKTIGSVAFLLYCFLCILFACFQVVAPGNQKKFFISGNVHAGFALDEGSYVNFIQ
jgi:hypothetical protein